MKSVLRCSLSLSWLSSFSNHGSFRVVSRVAANRFSTSTAAASTAWPPAAPILTKNVYSSFMDAVGNTSLIQLRAPSAITGCNILAKCEFENPGGSVKDRAAVYIVKDAEERGVLVPGRPGLIVEGTAGNTGIGLALVGNARGYKTIIVIPESQSKEKKDTLRFMGAELFEVPAVPFKNPSNYVHVASRLACSLAEQGVLKEYEGRVLYADQWANPANKRAHVEGTGPEIWQQTDGNIHAFSSSTGTGGTLVGVGTYLKEKNPKIKLFLTDPCGAGLVHLYHHGSLKANGDSISEGIGQNRVTGQMQGFEKLIDNAFEIPDQDALPIMYDLLRNEGLCVGTSSAINVAGAMRVARELGPGHTIVTVLCDAGTRYASRIYNPVFLRSRNLPVPSWLDEQPANSNPQRDLIKSKLAKVINPATASN